MSKTLAAKIDLQKLTGSVVKKGKRGQDVIYIDCEQAGLYVGAKGVYVDAVIFLNDEADQYGNNGSIAKSKPRDSQDKTIYLGNVKYLGQQSTSSARVEDAQIVDEEDDMPF